MGMIELYGQYGVPVADEGDKHYREGWINSACPYCTGNPGFHLGFNLDDSYYYCFRCGYHNVNESIEKVLNISSIEASKVAKDFKVHKLHQRGKVSSEAKIKIHPFQFPTDTTKMKHAHRHYLSNRGFDPDYLEKEFGLLGTGPISILDHIPYKFRIIAPIHWNGEVASFQSRDYTNKQEKRYLACPMAREQVHHKYILYTKPNDRQSVGIAVEGITDVWRFGTNAFATFGIAYTSKQVKEIVRRYEAIFIVFDPERQAQDMALKLKAEIELNGIPVHNITLDCDPAELAQDDADHLLKELRKRKLHNI